MKKGILFLGTLLFLATACQERAKNMDAKAALLEEIYPLEKQLLETGDASKEKETALALIEKCSEYAKAFPNDANSPEFLFKAADVARGAKEYGKAVQLWGQLWRKYPDHPKAPMALFLQGFTFDNELRDTQMAGKYYKDFLKTYPNDSLATQVQQLLQVVEISPDELVKQFKEKQ